jgi:hypothetical protein
MFSPHTESHQCRVMGIVDGGAVSALYSSRLLLVVSLHEFGDYAVNRNLQWMECRQ